MTASDEGRPSPAAMRKARLSLSLALYVLFLGLYLLTSPFRFEGVDGGLRYAVTRSILERGELHVDRVRLLPLAPHLLVWGDGAFLWELARSEPPLPLQALINGDYEALSRYLRLYSHVVVRGGKRYRVPYRVTPLSIWGDDWRELHPDGTRVGRGLRVFANYPVGHSLLMVPFAAIGGERLASVAVPIVAAAVPSICFLLLLALGYSSRRSSLVALIVGAGSILWPYATSTHDAALTTLFSALALYGLVRSASGAIWPLLVAGVGAGLAVVTKQSNLVLLPAAFAYLALRGWEQARSASQPAAIWRQRWRWWLSRGAVFALAFAPFWAFDRWYWWLRFGGVHTRGSATSLLPNVPRQTVTELVNRVWGFHLEGFYGFLVSPSKSIFLFTPPLVLTIALLPRFVRRQRPAAAALLVFAALSYIGHAALFHWGGDYAWGPRYLVAASALLLLPLAEWPRRRWFSLVAGLLVGFSVLVQLSATLVDNDRYYSAARLEQGWHYDPLKRREVYFSLRHFRITAQIADAWRLGGRTLDALGRIDRLPPGRAPNPGVFHARPPRIRDRTDLMLATRTWWNLWNVWYPLAIYKRWAAPETLDLLLGLNVVVILAAGVALVYLLRRQREGQLEPSG